MFVSGLTIQKKKINNQRNSSLNKQKPNFRPLSSSQLPQIQQVKHKNYHQMYSQINRQYQQKQVQQIQKKDGRARHTSSSKASISKLALRKNLSSQKVFHSPQQSLKNSYKQLKQPRLKQIKQYSTNLIDQSKNKKKLELNFRTQKNTKSSVLYDPIQKEKIIKYFRYYPLVIIQTCNKRQEFIKTLNQYGDIDVYNHHKTIIAKRNSVTTGSSKKQSPQLDCMEPWLKLIKIAQLKGKYKYRQKFNFTLSAQLKAINFKRKQYKKKKQSSSSQSQEQQKKQKCRDLQTWKKSMGVQSAKVFIIKGKYPDFKNALLQRGWVQNPDKHSSFFDLKWTTKVNDLVFQTLKNNQIVNHFNNNACLTSKYGICKSLRSVMYADEIDIDKFFPKAFDLTDVSDFQNFVQVYKWVYAQALLKQFINELNPTDNRVFLAKIAIVMLTRRYIKAQVLIKNTLLQKYHICSINEWLTITNQTIKQDLAQFNQVFQHWNLSSNNLQQVRQKAKDILLKIQQSDPQYSLDGSKNIWIVKPAFLSRGRGIKCLSKFNDIMNYALGKDTQYVVQKYIENPLIINKKKFDIRLWVIVEDYNPPKIWIYGQFYCRFCIDQYDQSKLTNKFAHLTNNSIQKYNKGLSAQELKEQLKNSMWTQSQLQQHIKCNYQQGSFKQILSKMKQIVISTILSTVDQVYGRKNSFQLIGYDFMIDDKLNPWLIQINTSPSMDHSTPVTHRLVTMVLEDTAKVVVDNKRKKTKKAGLFKLVYNGETKFLTKHYSLINKQPEQKN